MLNGATPIFTALLATFLLRSLPGRLQMAGLIVGFVGIVAIALPSAGGSTTAAVGVLMVIFATIGYAVSLNVVTPLAQKYGALPIMARILRLAAILVTPYGIYGLTQSSFAWPSLFAMLTVGVVGTGIAFYMMGALTSSVGATRSAFITYVIPVVALALGVAFPRRDGGADRDRWCGLSHHRYPVCITPRAIGARKKPDPSTRQVGSLSQSTCCELLVAETAT